MVCFICFLSMGVFAQNYEVKGAGTVEINGIYTPSGKVNGKTRYVKGEYVLFYKGCHSKWMIMSPGGNLYRNQLDSATPPERGWEKGCGKGSMDPAPVVLLVIEEPSKKSIEQPKR